MVEQILVSPLVKQSMIISKLVYKNCLTICQTTSVNLRKSGIKSFASTSKNLLKNRNWTFPVLRYLKTRVWIKYLWRIAASCVVHVLCGSISECLEAPRETLSSVENNMKTSCWYIVCFWWYFSCALAIAIFHYTI